MLFHTPEFIVFFVVVFLVFWSLPRHHWRLNWLLGASCIFYMSWNPWLITLIFFSATMDYFAALAIQNSQSKNRQRIYLIATISINLILLVYFKYINFFLDSLQSATSLFGYPLHFETLNIILPLGISFYTFETIAYIVDVYRGRCPAVANYRDYLLFIMFFPHLIAGPIVRPSEFLPQLERQKRFQWTRMQWGVQYFLIGLFKKAVIADHMAQVADPVFANLTAVGTGMMWLGLLSYSVQIYCDFSGYSDMAIGTAHMLGFKLPRNFWLPYFATNISDFWNRWHISLSRWLKDYVYIPLGGNRQTTWKTNRNLLLTMLIGGIWHGANWTFIIWGLYHGGLLIIDRQLRPLRTKASWLMLPFSIVTTFLLVTIGWSFFRAQSIGDIAVILQTLFSFVPDHGIAIPTIQFTLFLMIIFILGQVLSSTVDWHRVTRHIPPALNGTALALFLMITMMLMPESGQGFLYFQF